MKATAKKVAGPLAVGGAALVCLPCLLPLLAVLIGIGTLSASAGWLADNALVAGLGASAALLALLAGGWALVARRRRAVPCSPRGVEPG